MVSPISPIGNPLGGISPVSGLDKITDIGNLGAAGALTGTDKSVEAQGPNESFASLLSRGLESVQASQTKASDLAIQAADGTLQDPAQYTMAANEAQLGLQLTLAVRNKAVEAFQEIMRMQA